MDRVSGQYLLILEYSTFHVCFWNCLAFNKTKFSLFFHTHDHIKHVVNSYFAFLKKTNSRRLKRLFINVLPYRDRASHKRLSTTGKSSKNRCFRKFGDRSAIILELQWLPINTLRSATNNKILRYNTVGKISPSVLHNLTYPAENQYLSKQNESFAQEQE